MFCQFKYDSWILKKKSIHENHTCKNYTHNLEFEICEIESTVKDELEFTFLIKCKARYQFWT